MRVVAGESGFGRADRLGPDPAARARPRGIPSVHQARPDPDPRRERAQLPRHDARGRPPRADRLDLRAAGVGLRHHQGPDAARRHRPGVPAAQDPAARLGPDDLGRHPVDHPRARGFARALDHAPRRARRRLRNGRAPPRRVRHRKERVRAGPRPSRPPAGRRRRGRNPPVPERGARRTRRRDDPLPHGAARHRHHQHQAPLRGLGRAGLQVGRARHRARAVGPDQEVRPARPGRRVRTRSWSGSCRACDCRSPPAATSRCSSRSPRATSC